ncbi:helix-turn-helix transcriptional regulator [Streptomyces tuirus]|uniref:Helix-turn-helix transcriptional regulator n=1 Tax=Streptomyces tuirus TaxID=68278 RepID=A0A941J0C0_9ACTN|nr:helix-turn-helix transcriptional regulator [Streptomyces tuirus]
METVPLCLDHPPEVVNAGVGVHGVSTAHDVFRLPDLWQLHLYSYAGRLSVAGTVHPIRPGHVSLIPPDTEAHFHYRGRSEHLYAHLRLPGTGAGHRVPLMQDAQAEGPLLARLLRHAVTAMPVSAARASAEVWAVLWHIAQLPRAGSEEPGRQHPVVAAAQAYVEEHLAEPLPVPDIARSAGVSHTHLTRLFRAETGLTVVAYVRRRRLARARHLLQASTLPIPAVAAAVGIADLQAFNKACRRELGAGPRAVRATRAL